MVATMRALSSTMKSVVSDTTTGPMASLMLDTGERTKWTEMVSSDGKMAKSTLVSSLTISVKVKVLSFGPMAVNTSVSGKLVSSMVSAPTSAKKELRNRASGRMVVRLDG